jgi:hypothetical protein
MMLSREQHNCTFSKKYYYGDNVKDDMVGGACRTDQLRSAYKFYRKVRRGEIT